MAGRFRKDLWNVACTSFTYDGHPCPACPCPAVRYESPRREQGVEEARCPRCGASWREFKEYDDRRETIVTMVERTDEDTEGS